MDPNANLEEQERIVVGRKLGAFDDRDKARLKELRVALIDWLKGGGPHPNWKKNPKASLYFDSYFRQIRGFRP